MVTLAYNVVKIIVSMKITHPRQATPGGPTVESPSLVASQAKNSGVQQTVEEHVAPLRLDDLSLVEDAAFSLFSSDPCA